MTARTPAAPPRQPIETWEEHWRAYDEATQRNPAHRYRRELIFSAMQPSGEPMRILDIGCGQGDFLADAAHRLAGAQLAGLDGSEAGLELAHRKVPAATLRRADFSATAPLPIELKGFATHAVCSEVLEHLEDPERLLRNVRPLLSPGGRLIVTVPGGPRTAFDMHLGHVRHYSPKELAELLARSGYTALTVKGAGFPFFNLYKLVLFLRGRRLVRDLDRSRGTSTVLLAAMKAFDWAFRLNRDDTGFGWQSFGVFESA